MGEPGTSAGAASGGPDGGGGATDGKKLECVDPSTMTADELKQFIDTGRTGRRNALPDVTEKGVITTSTADVADALNSLSVQAVGTGVYLKPIFLNKAAVKSLDFKMQKMSDKDKIQLAPGTTLAKYQAMMLIAEELSTQTHFSQEECLALLHTHDNLVYRGKLDRGRFRQFFHSCFDLTSDMMLDLLFRGFDRNGDGTVDETEFVHGLSRMIRGNMDELTEFCYFVYDMNGDRSLAREELSQCLRGCFQAGYGIDVEEMEEAEKDIVELAMKKLDHDRDGQITYEDFRMSVMKDPLLLVACGECLPPEDALARFLYTITDDYRSYTGPLLGSESIRRRVDSRLNSRTLFGSRHSLGSMSMTGPHPSPSARKSETG